MNNLTGNVDEIMEHFCPRNQPGASLLISRGDNVLIHKGFGLADLDAEVSAEPETKYLLASVSKQFACAAVMLLAEEGKLDIDAAIGRYSKHFPAFGQSVTLRHIMTHTSGIPDYFNDAFHQAYCLDDSPELSLEDLLVFIDENFSEPDFEPGTSWAYSNSGYVLLDEIVENVSGVSLDRFLKEKIFDPLEMTRTIVGTSGKRLSGMATGHQRNKDGAFTAAPYNRTVVGWADGNIISTCGDLFKWLRAVKAGRVLKTASWNKIFTPGRLLNGESVNYGFGWFLSNRRGAPERWHTGGTPGFQCRVSHFVEDDAIVIWLLNSDPDSIGDLNIPFGRIVHKVMEGRLSPLPEWKPLPEAAKSTWIGQWEATPLGEDDPARFRIDADSENRLLLDGLINKSGGQWPLLPETENRLWIDSGADYFLEAAEKGVLFLNRHGRKVRLTPNSTEKEDRI